MISPYVFPGLQNVKLASMKIRKQRNDQIANNIIQSICFDRDVTKTEVVGKRKFKELVEARYLSIYMIKTKTDMTLKEIGKIFNRDHATIIYAVESIKDTMSYDKVIRAEVERLTLLF